MRALARAALAVAAISSLSIPAAHAQFGGGFGAGQGFSTGTPGTAGASGSSSGQGSLGEPGQDAPDANTSTSDGDNAPAAAPETPAPAPAPAATTEWVCGEGWTPLLDDNGGWATDENGTPLCVPVDDGAAVDGGDEWSDSWAESWVE